MALGRNFHCHKYFTFQIGVRRNKLNTLVDFPVKSMDMSNHLLQRNSGNIDQGRQIYDLYGVCNHYGNMLGGHYTGMFENFEGDTQKTVKS